VSTLLRHAEEWNPRQAAGALYQLATEVLQTLDLDRVLLSLANAAAGLLAAEVAGVFLLEGGMLAMRCAVGHRSVGTARLRIEPGHGVAGKVVETGRPERVDDYVTDPSITKEYLGIALEEGTQSALCVPMFDREGAVLGVLGVWRRRRSIFVDDDEGQLVALAGLASIAVQNARLFELQREATEQLRRAQAELEERFRSADLALRVHQELTRIAAEGQHLDALARAVHGLMGGGVVLLSTDGRRLAAHPDGLTDAPVADRTSRGSGARSVVTAGGVSWLVAPIEAGSTPYGHLCLRLDEDPATTQQSVAVEQAATVCALLMAREEAVQSASTRLQSEFVWDLLEGRVADADEAVRRARSDYGLELPVRLVLVHAAGFQNLSRAEDWSPEELDRARNWVAERLTRSLAGETGQRVIVAHRGDNFAALVGRREGDSAAAARELGLAAVAESPFRSVRLRAGISRLAGSPDALRSALHEAERAMSATGGLRGGVAVFDELGILQFLLAPTSGEELERFARSVLGALVNYDEKRGTELVATLEAYLDSGCSVAEAARRLHLHQKSLRYRLKRIFELTGLDLESREERLRAELALRVLAPVSR
jgi:sugar diacid utilization regulator/putative methionine-R-sulfoxide reductase with GAF domain